MNTVRGCLRKGRSPFRQHPAGKDKIMWNTVDQVPHPNRALVVMQIDNDGEKNFIKIVAGMAEIFPDDDGEKHYIIWADDDSGELIDSREPVWRGSRWAYQTDLIKAEHTRKAFEFDNLGVHADFVEDGRII